MDFKIYSHYLIIKHQNETNEGLKTTCSITIYDLVNQTFVHQSSAIRNIVSFKFNAISKWLLILIDDNGLRLKFEKIKDKCHNLLSEVSKSLNKDYKYPILDFISTEDNLWILDKRNIILESLYAEPPIISMELNRNLYYKIKFLNDKGSVLLSQDDIRIKKLDKIYLFKSSYTDDRTIAINPNVSLLIESRIGKFTIYSIDTQEKQEYTFDEFPNIVLDENEFFHATRIAFVDDSKCVFIHNKGFSIWEFDDLTLHKSPVFIEYGNDVSIEPPILNTKYDLLYSKTLNQLYFINGQILQVVDLKTNKLSDCKGIDLSKLGNIQFIELSEDESTLLVTGRTDGEIRSTHYGISCDFFTLINTSMWRIVDHLKTEIDFTACHFGHDCESVLFADMYGNIHSYEYLPLHKLIKRETERFKDTPLSDDEKRTFFLK